MDRLPSEFLDYGISKVVESYKEVTNKLIAIINEGTYRRKERLIEALNMAIK